MSNPLTVQEGYALWATTYEQENAITVLDEQAAASLCPPRAGARLLDVGCGTGRRFAAASEVGSAIGVDLVPAMLAEGRRRGRGNLLAGSALALPFPTARFDQLWCRLMIGHLPALANVYGELARVTAAGGKMLVTDFHPSLAARGGARRFSDERGETHELVHFPHSGEEHLRCAGGAGLQLEAKLELCINESVRGFFERAGKAEEYQRLIGTPALLAFLFRKPSRGEFAAQRGLL